MKLQIFPLPLPDSGNTNYLFESKYLYIRHFQLTEIVPAFPKMEKRQEQNRKLISRSTISECY